MKRTTLEEGRRLVAQHDATGSLRDADHGRDWFWFNRRHLLALARAYLDTHGDYEEDQPAPTQTGFPEPSSLAKEQASRLDAAEPAPQCNGSCGSLFCGAIYGRKADE